MYVGARGMNRNSEKINKQKEKKIRWVQRPAKGYE